MCLSRCRARRPALTALLSLVMTLLLVRTHAGVTIEDTGGLYRSKFVEANCPDTLSVGNNIDTSASLSTSGSCSPGKIALLENPPAGSGDRFTQLLVSRGAQYVGTIVLGTVTSAVTCATNNTSETIRVGSFASFLRPRRLTEIKFERPMRFSVGKFYLALSTRCIYVKDQDAQPTPAPNPNAVAQGSSTSGSAGAKNEGVRISPWAWAGPLIAVGVLALAGLAWWAVSRNNARAQEGYIMEEETVSNDSDIGPGQERRISLGGPLTESESETDVTEATDVSSSIGGR